MNSSSQSFSNKPHIFINHVDLSINEQDILKACENKKTNPTSINIHKNHDQKSNYVNITFSSENEVVIASVTWKMQENSEDKTLIFKFLKQEVTPSQIKSVISSYGEITSIEQIPVIEIPGKTKTQSYSVMMDNESACKTVMSEGIKNQKVKDLFNQNRPYITPCISKMDFQNYKSSIKFNNNNQVLNQSNQFYSHMQMMNPGMAPIGTPLLFPSSYNYPGVMNQYFQQRNIQMQKMQPQYSYVQQQPQYYQQFNNNNNINNNYHHQNNQYKKFGGYYKNNGQHQQNNQNQNQTFQNAYQKNQSQPKQQEAPKSQYTHESLNQLLAQDSQKFDETIKKLISQLVDFHLKQNPNYQKFQDKSKQIFSMLTDKEIFDNQDWIDLVTDDKEMRDRLQEAIELLQQ